MRDALNAAGICLMVFGGAVCASCVAFMFASNVGDRASRELDVDPHEQSPGPMGIYFWIRRRDALELVAKISFGAFWIGFLLSGLSGAA